MALNGIKRHMQKHVEILHGGLRIRVCGLSEDRSCYDGDTSSFFGEIVEVQQHHEIYLKSVHKWPNETIGHYRTMAELVNYVNSPAFKNC